MKFFLDTNIIWNDFLIDSYLRDHYQIFQRWYYELGEAITFTKCVYESLMIGKSTKRKNISDTDSDYRKLLKNAENKFVEKYPNLNVGKNILGKSDAFTLYEVQEYEWAKAPFDLPTLSQARIPPLKRKVLKKGLDFDKDFRQFRCEFNKFLDLHNIEEHSYYQVFSKDFDWHIPKDTFHFGGLFDHLHLPSEDLEIVLAALSLKSDFFLTNDEKLYKNWRSIGLNFHYPQPIYIYGDGKCNLYDLLIKAHDKLKQRTKFDNWAEKLLNYSTHNMTEFKK